MNISRAPVYLVCLLLAVVFYTIGFGRGIELAIGLGLLFEVLFWFGFFNNESSEESNSEPKQEHKRLVD